MLLLLRSCTVPHTLSLSSFPTLLLRPLPQILGVTHYSDAEYLGGDFTLMTSP